MILDGQRALVTGGSRGIGKAIALALAEAGADVVINYNSSQDEALEVVESIRGMGRNAEAVQADVSDFAQAGTLVKAATEFHGGLDIVINNAGITRDKLLMAMKPEDFSDVVDTNLGGCFNITHQACRGLIRNRRGTVINITSVSGMVGMKGQANYSASKAGIIGFTKAMAKELASRNITVNAVAPGFVESDMTAKLGDMYLKEMLKFIPMGRLGTAEEVGQTVVFLCSDAARYITGQVMVLDGGLTM